MLQATQIACQPVQIWTNIERECQKATNTWIQPVQKMEMKFEAGKILLWAVEIVWFKHWLL